MDVLSEILSSLRISGSVLAEIEGGGAWGIDMGPGDGVPFHYVTEGECWLIDGPTATRLSVGDLVVAPHWLSHSLASSPTQLCLPIRVVIAANGLPAWTGGTLDRPLLIRTGASCDVRILSGVFTVKGRGATMLLGQLPPILHLRAQAEGLVPQLRTALEFIRQENTVTRPGFIAVASRLMDLLFIQILRAAIMQTTVKIGFLAGLSDARLGRALAAIHANPAAQWTVATLAAEARHSRTLFAERFRQVVGVTPIQYVNQWRITLAEDLLAQPATAIDKVRRQLGFSSGFAFARTFRALRGMSPREYRRSCTESLP